MFTRRWSTLCSEWHFRTPLVQISTAPQSRTETVQLGYVYTIYTKLGGPVENLQQVYGSKTAHGSSPGHVKQSAVKGIFVQLLYGFVRLPEVRPEELN